MKAMAQKSWARGEPLSLVELPTPEPRRGEMRVAVKAAGVNPVDWKMRSFGPLRLAARLIGPRPPVVVGVDFAGIVDAVGSGVEGVRPGDAVVGGTDFSRRQRGSYADTVVVREDQVCKLPEGFDLEVAGALPVTGVTAWMSVMDLGGLGNARGEGEDRPRVLVIGASGGVGHLAVQIAKLHGAEVVGVCSTRNVEYVKSLGADVVIDYTAGPPLEAAAKLGRYQAVLDCVGGYPGSACRALLGPGGRFVIVSGDKPGDIVDAGLHPFSTRLILGTPNGARLRPVVEAVHAGKLQVNIVERLPLTEAERAHELSRSGRMTGKILLVV